MKLKISIALLALVVASPSTFARESSAKSDCYVQAINTRILENEIYQLNPFDRLVLQTYEYGTFVNAMIGELPVLGRGAITVLATSAGNIAVYEKDPKAPGATRIRANATVGLIEIGYYKACVRELKPSTAKAKSIGNIVRSNFNLQTPVRYFEFSFTNP